MTKSRPLDMSFRTNVRNLRKSIQQSAVSFQLIKTAERSRGQIFILDSAKEQLPPLPISSDPGETDLFFYVI